MNIQSRDPLAQLCGIVRIVLVFNIILTKPFYCTRVIDKTIYGTTAELTVDTVDNRLSLAILCSRCITLIRDLFCAPLRHARTFGPDNASILIKNH